MSASQPLRHSVKIRLSYMRSGLPYKWNAVCICGYHAVSWQWIAVDRPGGALPMALEHLEHHYPKESSDER